MPATYTSKLDMFGLNPSPWLLLPRWHSLFSHRIVAGILRRSIALGMLSCSWRALQIALELAVAVTTI